MLKTRALCLDAGAAAVAAIGLHQVIEVVTEGEVIAVPMAPAYCRELLQWRDQWIPVFDLAAWGGSQPESTERFYVVVGYFPDGAGLQFGSLRVREFPKIVALSDQQACALPHGVDWCRIAVACFQDGGRTVPILSLDKVFRQQEPRAAGSPLAA